MSGSSSTWSPFSKATSKICIIGGGNAGHVFASALPYLGYQTYWYASFADEAERISAALEKHGKIHAVFPAASDCPSSSSHPLIHGPINGVPLKISKDPAEVISDSDVLLLLAPSFCHDTLLHEIKPYLREGHIICVSPGQGGFDWLAKTILGEDLFKKLVIFALLPMPVNCRITELGRNVQVEAWKRNYKVGCIPSCAGPIVLNICNELFGATESVGHFLSCTLYPVNAILHPSRLYELIGKDYQDGMILKANPLFYEDMTPKTIENMNKLNAELIEVGKALRKAGMTNVTVPHLFEFLSYVYGPHESLLHLLTSNSAYKGFRCPFKEHKKDGKEVTEWLPDFSNRYFTEDIPEGLCVYKGVAEIVGVETPFIDEVIEWAQKHMKKEYLVDGKLKGKDLLETSSPQRFGITTLDGLR